MLFDPVCVFSLSLPCSQLRPAVQRAAMCCSSERPASWVGCECSSRWPSRARSRRSAKSRERQGMQRKARDRECKAADWQGNAKEGTGQGGNGYEVESPARGHAARCEIDEKLALAQASKARGNKRRAREESSCRSSSRRGRCKQAWHAAVAPLIEAHCEMLSLIALQDAALQPCLRPEASCQLLCWLRACDSGLGSESASPGRGVVRLLAAFQRRQGVPAAELLAAAVPVPCAWIGPGVLAPGV